MFTREEKRLFDVVREQFADDGAVLGCLLDYAMERFADPEPWRPKVGDHVRCISDAHPKMLRYAGVVREIKDNGMAVVVDEPVDRLITVPVANLALAEPTAAPDAPPEKPAWVPSLGDRVHVKGWGGHYWIHAVSWISGEPRFKLRSKPTCEDPGNLFNLFRADELEPATEPEKASWRPAEGVPVVRRRDGRKGKILYLFARGEVTSDADVIWADDGTRERVEIGELGPEPEKPAWRPQVGDRVVRISDGRHGRVAVDLDEYPDTFTVHYDDRWWSIENVADLRPKERD